jgi:formate dehydrogenase major subunit
MVIHTHSPAVLEARRTVLALLLQSGNHNCAIAKKSFAEWTEFQQQVESYDQSTELCSAHSACRLQAYAYRYQVDTSGLTTIESPYAMETASRLIVRDFSRCIRCGRCVDACNVIQVNNAITHGFRGVRAKIITKGDQPIERSECVFCGQCIQACPVAALVEKKSRYRIRPWEARHVRTTCYYCGVGCQLDLHIKDNTIMNVTGVEDALPNLGRLCVRGRFGYDFVTSPERLTHPMIRENGKLRKASWEEALDLVATKIKDAKADQGPETIAGICSAKLTNEASYLMQKLFRAAIGSNHLDSPYAGNGLNNALYEIEKTKRLILIDCDVTEENPVAGTFIKRAANNGCRLIIVNSRPTKIGKFATLHLRVNEGTELVLINGIIRQLLERGRKGSKETREIAESFPLDRVAETTGLLSEDITATIDILDSAEPTMVVYGTRVAKLAPVIVRLQEMLGNLGRYYAGVNYLGDMNNSQGACDMGLLPDYLPGYRRVDNDQDCKPFEDAWGVLLNREPGFSLNELVGHMNAHNQNAEKRIGLIYLVGEDPVLLEPVIPGIREALKSVEFLVLQDILHSESVNYADVVLPASSWAEEEGTYTNCERRVSRVRRAVNGPGETQPATWIFTRLARHLGQDWPEHNNQEIWENEIVPLVPQLQGITYGRIDKGGIPWSFSRASLLHQPGANGNRMALHHAPASSFNYHHRRLLEQCDGLLESLPPAKAEDNLITPYNPQEVRDNFVEVLREEEKINEKARIDEILETYKIRRGGLIPVLQQIQEILGFLPVAVQNYIALGLGIPPTDVFGVVSFYSFFTMVPRGRHIIRVCLGTACFVNGSGKVLETVERHLKVNIGETTDDREFSLDVVRCIGACGLAPTMVVDNITHGQVDPSTIVELVEGYRGV